jgi:hypothetical protein
MSLCLHGIHTPEYVAGACHAACMAGPAPSRARRALLLLLLPLHRTALSCPIRFDRVLLRKWWCCRLFWALPTDECGGPWWLVSHAWAWPRENNGAIGMSVWLAVWLTGYNTGTDHALMGLSECSGNQTKPMRSEPYPTLPTVLGMGLVCSPAPPHPCGYLVLSSTACGPFFLSSLATAHRAASTAPCQGCCRPCPVWVSTLAFK